MKEERLSLRLREAAKMLGVSERWLWQQARDGHIPCVRIGRGRKLLTLFPFDELRRWLADESRRAGGQ